MTDSQPSIAQHTYRRFLRRALGVSTNGTWMFYLWMLVLTAIALVGANAWAVQVRDGMVRTHMSDHVSWGLYIANFTFCVGLAAGGVMTEIYRDRSLRLAPVDLAEAREMIGEVKMITTLSGYRGRPAGDLDALARAIVTLSRFADDPTVMEAEINPLIVRPAGQGVIAVDALVKLAGKA